MQRRSKAAKRCLLCASRRLSLQGMALAIRTISLPALLALFGCVTDSPAPQAVAFRSGLASITITRSSSLKYAAAPASVELNGAEIANLAVGETYNGPLVSGRVIVVVSTRSAPGSSSYGFAAQPGDAYRLEVTPRTEPIVAAMAGDVAGQAIEGNGPFRITPGP